MANAEQERLAAAINEISNNELVQVGQEVSTQRGKMRVVMNTLMGRVYSETDAKLEMHAALDDKDMYFEGVVRCCSEEVLNDDVPADGWGLTKSIVEKKEIIAVFGVGTDGQSLAEFKGECATTGKRARSSTALMLPTLFEASTSSFVTLLCGSRPRTAAFGGGGSLGSASTCRPHPASHSCQSAAVRWCCSRMYSTLWT